MKVLMYGYARPDYLKLTLNSLFFNSLSANVYLSINHDPDTSHHIRKIAESFAKKYPDRFNFAYLDSNYLQNAVDVSYQMALSDGLLDDENIFITEDDIIIPASFAAKYGDFIEVLYTRAKNTGHITGVGFGTGNHYEQNEPSIPREEVDHLFQRERIGTWYMCAPLSLYRHLTNELKRVPFDTELINGRECQTLKSLAYHLGWNRQMDYPEYYKELYTRRVSENWQSHYKLPENNPKALYLYTTRNGFEKNVKFGWSWNERD